MIHVKTSHAARFLRYKIVYSFEAYICRYVLVQDFCASIWYLAWQSIGNRRMYAKAFIQNR